MNERIQQLVDVPGDLLDECAIRLQEWIDERSEARSRVPVNIRVSQATTAVVYLNIALLLGLLLFMPLCFLAGEPEDTTSMSHHPTEATPAIAVPALESESDSNLPLAGPAMPSDQAAAGVVEGATRAGDEDDCPGLGSGPKGLAQAQLSEENAVRPSQQGGFSESEDENKNDNKVQRMMRAATTNLTRKSPMMNGVAVHEEDEFAAAPVPLPLLSGTADEAAASTMKTSSVSEPEVSEDGSNSTCPPSTPTKKGLPMLVVAFVAGGLLNLSAFLSVPCF